MEQNYYEKYLKYKSKYFDLVANIKDVNNQEGGANKYDHQYKISFMLNIKEGTTLKNGISIRYDKIREHITEVESQTPHFTLFEIIINASHPQVQSYVNNFLSKPRNIGKSWSNAIKYMFGNYLKNIDISDFSANYTQGVYSYTVFENDDKYFFAKEFTIDNLKTKQLIDGIRTSIINILLANMFNIQSIPQLETSIFNGKPIKELKHNREYVFYYNQLYENPLKLHITVAKIRKDIWNTKYDVFNISSSTLSNSHYFLNVCKKIISLSSLPQLVTSEQITSTILEIKLSIMEQL